MDNQLYLQSASPAKKKLSKNSSKDLSEDTKTVYDLCKVKSRPKTTAYFLQSTGSKFSQADIGRIYKEVNGISPPKGLSPFNANRMILTSEMRFHASYFAKKYQQLEKLGLAGARLHLGTYNYYLHEFETTLEEAQLSFEQAFHIMQSIKIGDLIYAKCPKSDCKSSFLNVFGVPLNTHSCPVCTLFKKRTRKLIAQSETPTARQPTQMAIL